jgi:hypothetical protein
MILTSNLAQNTSLSTFNNCFSEWSNSLTIQNIFNSLLPKFDDLMNDMQILQSTFSSYEESISSIFTALNDSILSQFSKSFSLIEEIMNYLPLPFLNYHLISVQTLVHFLFPLIALITH